MYKVSQLQGYLPHFGKMEWIDTVEEFSEGWGVCSVLVDTHKLYCTEGKFRQTSCIEFIAQGYGFVIAANIKKLTGKVIRIDSAFLVGMTNIQFFEKLPTVGEKVLIDIVEERKIGQISFVKGKVFSANDGEKYCEATLKLYSN